MFIRNRRGQSTLEYVILIGFVVAALIAMGVYMKRGFQGRLRESTDQIGQQYSPGETLSNYTTNTVIQSTETTAGGGATTTTYQQNLQQRTGGESISNFEDEYWGPSSASGND